jgi:hypothetical protein
MGDRSLLEKARVAGTLARQRSDRARHVAVERAGRKPIVVLTWSKTGSSTLHLTLARSHLARPVYDTHELDPEMAARAQHVARIGEANHVSQARLDRIALLQGQLADPDRAMSFVTAVRDPVSRAIASFFQAYRSTGVIERFGTPAGDDVDKLVAQLHERLPDLIDSTDRWFDREPLALLGIDLFAEPFDHEGGWSLVERGRFDQVVLRTDRINEIGTTALSALTGRRIRRIHNKNLAGTKAYAAYRTAVLEQFRLTQSEIDLALQTRTLQHFFTEAERDRLVQTWTSAGVH